jgi:hypothetical protein
MMIPGLALGGAVLSKVASTLIKALLTEKVILRIVVSLMEKLVASTKTDLDNEVLDILKEELKNK